MTRAGGSAEARGLLRQAVQLEGSGALREALSSLLAAWALVRAPAIANRVDALSKTLEPSLPIVDVTGPGGFRTAVVKRIEGSSSLDVGAIVTGFTVRQRALGVLFIAEQLVRLFERHPNDPRLSRLAWQTCRDLRISHPTAAGRALFVQLCTRAVELGDPRFATNLYDEVQSGLRFFPGRNEDGRRDLSALETLAERLDPEGGATDPHWVLRELAARSSPKRALSGLLDAVYATPDDLERRLVYADALQEAGDPRGEFIALQCGRQDGRVSAREKALLRNLGSVWLGEHEKAFERVGLEFRRGFLATARLKWKHALVGPEWATIEALDLPDTYGGARDAKAVCEFLQRGDLQALRALWVSGDCLLPLRRTLPNVTCLGLTRDVSERVLRLFPGLRRFEAHTLERSEATALLRRCPKLEAVQLGSAEAVPLLRGKVSQIELSGRHGLSTPVAPLVLTLRGSGFERLEVSTLSRNVPKHSPRWVEEWLEQLPRRSISSVTLAPALDQPWLRAALRPCLTAAATWSREAVAVASWRDVARSSAPG